MSVMDAHNIEFYCNLKKKFLEGREKNEMATNTGFYY